MARAGGRGASIALPGRATARLLTRSGGSRFAVWIPAGTKGAALVADAFARLTEGLANGGRCFDLEAQTGEFECSRCAEEEWRHA